MMKRFSSVFLACLFAFVCFFPSQVYAADAADIELYLYGDFILPALPTVDSEYSNILIVPGPSGFQSFFVFGDMVVTENGVYALTDCSVMFYMLSDNGWEFFSSFSCSAGQFVFPYPSYLFWTRYDVFFEDGAVFNTGSAPVLLGSFDNDEPAADDGIFHQTIVEIFGIYEPVIVTLSDGSTVPCVDISYLAGVAIFCICLFSLFKLVGVLFKR